MNLGFLGIQGSIPCNQTNSEQMSESKHTHENGFSKVKQTSNIKQQTNKIKLATFADFFKSNFRVSGRNFCLTFPRQKEGRKLATKFKLG